MPTLFPPSFGPPDRNNPIHLGLPRTPIRLARVKLLTDWHACESAEADLLDWSPKSADVQEAGGVTAKGDGIGVVVRDPCGIIEWELASIQDDAGLWYIPAGWYCTVWQPEDAGDGHWELVNVGRVCGAGSGSGSEGSGGSGSGSHGCKTPDDVRLGGLPNHNPAVKQALIHDENDCLAWMDIEPCP